MKLERLVISLAITLFIFIIFSKGMLLGNPKPDSNPSKQLKASLLVRVKELDPSIIEDMRYATSNNFTHKRIYSSAKAYLRKETAQKLLKANREFLKLGYRIKIWDAYRPLYVQKILWDNASDKSFVANPKNGSKHNRGASVDITLVDKSGKELQMPTGFDNFTDRASRLYPYTSSVAKNNLRILTRIMIDSGFHTINNEWWHYDDSDWQKYPLINIKI